MDMPLLSEPAQHNALAETLAKEQLNLAVGRLATMPGTMNLKRVMLEESAFQSMTFHLKFAPTPTVARRSKLSMFSFFCSLPFVARERFFKSS